MVKVIAITVILCVSLIAAILLKPSVRIGKAEIGTYWPIALLGAIALIATGSISLPEVGRGMVADSGINPIRILVLFLSMTVQSIFLDEAGMFRYCADLALKKAGNSQKKLFVYLYLIVAVLTVFTSNDIIILTFTPFICYFAKNAHIDPVPFLFTEFVAANTWSMTLIIGNPTNVYLASAQGIGFLEYVKVMAVPAVAGGLVGMLVLYLVFRKKLGQPILTERENVKIEDKGLLGIGLAHLSLCTVLLVAASYIGIEMWLITMCFALSLFVISSVYLLAGHRSLKILSTCLKRMPWELVPFVLSMFVVVLCLDSSGVTGLIGRTFGNGGTVFKYGVTSFIAANLVNNIPMSVLYSSIVNSLSADALLKGVYAAIVGSNLGAFFTPVGALAGIMWTGILKKHGVKFKFTTYVRYGSIVSIPTLAATLIVLDMVLK